MALVLSFTLVFSVVYKKALIDRQRADFSNTTTLVQKGTVVEKLTEEVLRDSKHLHELLSLCEGKTVKALVLVLSRWRIFSPC